MFIGTKKQTLISIIMFFNSHHTDIEINLEGTFKPILKNQCVLKNALLQTECL